MRFHFLRALLTLTCLSSLAASPEEDPYLWLEDVTSEQALTWVRAQNSISTNELQSSPNFEPIRRRLLAILDSKEKIPYVEKEGPYYYNFWRDQKNVRGLWRRTTLAEYKKASKIKDAAGEYAAGQIDTLQKHLDTAKSLKPGK